MYIIYGNYLGIVDKLLKSKFSFLQYEIRKWFEKENLVAFKARITAYENLSNHVAIKKNSLPVKIIINLLINELFSWLVQERMHLGVKCFIHNSQLVFLCNSLLIQRYLVFFIRSWFIAIKTDVRLIQLSLSNVHNGFIFMGFRIQKKGSTNIIFSISKKSQVLLWQTLSKIIQKSKGVSSYQLIQRLSPTIAFWSNYFKHVQCLKVFSYLDYLLHLRVWMWVLRCHSTDGKDKAKQKYFPEDRQCVYNRRLIKSKWVLYGSINTKTKGIRENFLVRFLWFKYLN